MQNQSTQLTKEDMRRKPRTLERIIHGFLFFCAAVSILVTVGIVYELGKEALLFFTITQWEEQKRRP